MKKEEEREYQSGADRRELTFTVRRPLMTRRERERERELVCVLCSAF